MKKKIKQAKELIKKSIEKYRNIAVACSFGKDSIVTVDLAQQVKKDIPVFSIMTPFKPKATFRYLLKMEKKMSIPLKVYYVGNSIPNEFQGNGLKVKLLDPSKFNKKASKIKQNTGKEIYDIDPDVCCKMLEDERTKEERKNRDREKGRY
jgi:3'-phosphoadenosine 5'-phosphosulfate sulfotransferase (PAPS reductase)/FAD synthetase